MDLDDNYDSLFAFQGNRFVSQSCGKGETGVGDTTLCIYMFFLEKSVHI